MNTPKTWQDKFREEFGIHFSESELQFALAFIEEREAEVRRERERVLAKLKTMYLPAGFDELTADVFYRMGHNSAIDDVLALLDVK